MGEEICRLTDADLDAVAGGTHRTPPDEIHEISYNLPPPPPTVGSVWNSFCDAAGAPAAKIT